MKKYVNKILNKDYIRLNTFSYTTLVLIVKKLDEGLRIYINYRTLNTLIIKNRNAPSLIRETLIRLYVARIYIKFDIIAIFNKIRIREGNKEKIIFLTRYGLFEYVIILFELYNILSTF